MAMMRRSRLDFKGLDEQASELLEEIGIELGFVGSALGRQLQERITRLYK